MKTLKQLLNELDACNEAVRWAEDKTIEQVIEQCHRGDWLLWLAQKVDIELCPLTLAKGHCVNTVRHLMKDKRSIKAVDTAIAFGEGKVAITELATAAAAAADAATDAYATAAYAAADVAAAYAATDVAYAAARIGNQQQTADICRQYIGKLIIDKVNELLNKQQDNGNRQTDHIVEANEKVTAVEWLQSIELERDLTLADWEQAKQMEKERIMKANVDGYEEAQNYGETSAEQYYNETYGK